MREILVTGNLGLVGRYLSPVLENKGYRIRGFDILENSNDIRDQAKIYGAVSRCSGLIHLAAVSRVVWAQNDPKKCWQTNAEASHSILNAALEQAHRPWVLCASSREIYGAQATLPVNERATPAPVNIYGRAKLAMETHAAQARAAGLNTAIVRLANVYGCTKDHDDRVLPAFCRNAVEGVPLRVEGGDNVFDFTHVFDTVEGIAIMAMMLDAGERNIPPIHLLPGIATSLGKAASIAVSAAGNSSEILEAPSRNYDVSRFVGNPARARELLGWEAGISPDQGIKMLVRAFQTAANKRMDLCES